MISAWVCTCEGLIVELKAHVQNDAYSSIRAQFTLRLFVCFVANQLLSLRRSVLSKETKLPTALRVTCRKVDCRFENWHGRFILFPIALPPDRVTCRNIQALRDEASSNELHGEKQYRRDNYLQLPF